MQTIEILNRSITSLDTDIIVNAANEYLRQGGGVCGYIFQAAGPKKLQEACDRIGYCETGSAVITPGFDLCRYIVHAVGPRWIDGRHKEPEQLYGCYRKAMDLARENDCHSIGFPLISAGIFGYPMKDAWTQAIRSIRDWTEENRDYDIEICFAVLDEKILKEGRETLRQTASDLMAVTRNDWKRSEMPERYEEFALSQEISQRQLKILKKGHYPVEMEDKWFFYMEGDVLYAHRSWTGFCIYVARFTDGKITVTVNRDPQQYTCTDIEEDKKRFTDLLSWWIKDPYDHYNEWLYETAKTLEKAEMK